MKQLYQNVFLETEGKKSILLTKNLTPGKSFFNENLIKKNNIEYREFDPKRSKLAAAILKRISIMPIKKDSVILYLGAAHGYTASFCSDIAENGFLFCLDFAPRVCRDLVFVCEQRKNMTALLENANHPENYKDKVTKVDIIYQDIAQKNQVEILLKNVNLFLKQNGYALLAIKSRSIDITKLPIQIYKDVEKELQKHLKIIDKRILDPYQKDHCFFVCQKK